MLSRSSPLQSLALGLIVTCAQIAIAIGFSNPAGSLADRYRALVQHDSYWFANIIDRGYGTIVPPIEHKEMEVSNVAFFPAYPWLAGSLHRLTTVSTYTALLIVAQAAAWGFWTYFFLFCRQWRLPMLLQAFGALAIIAHPAAFYLVAGYSESLFLMMLAGFIYWNMREGRTARVLAVLHGFTMSATRIVGLPCALFPLLYSLLPNEALSTTGWRVKLSRLRAPLLVTFLSLLGGLLFFVYCQVRWSRWDIYMLTQEAGWAIKPDYLAIFDWRNYRWTPPVLYDTTGANQFTGAIAIMLFLLFALAEGWAALRRRSGWMRRAGFYFCAAIVYYISITGVASVQMESMLRYELCVHALIVLAALHFLRDLHRPSRSVRALALGLAAVVFAAGLTLQGIYVWNFTQGNWVA